MTPAREAHRAAAQVAACTAPARTAAARAAAGLFGAAALFTATLLAACGDGGGSDDTVFPPPPEPVRTTHTLDDFAGSEACAGCHAEQYAAWARSTHGRAGGRPGPDVIIAPFDGRTIRFADARVVPRVRDGTYEFVVRQEGFPEATVPVTGVIGGGHMLGGGTQGFLTRLPDGTERFLPWDWSRGAQEWFCNTGTRLNEGWIPITPDLRLADCGDWPPSRPIGTIERFGNCQECHGSQIRTTFDTAQAAYRTRYTTLQVNCESCHGPARRHVEAAGAGFPDGPGDIGLESLAWIDKDSSLEVCFRCHALKDVITEGYLPGDPLPSFYAWKFPVLGDEPYFADGRVRTFAYQANHLASACYLEGPMDCVSCHEPHGQGYWDTDRRPLASPYDDGQCTSCHPSKLVDPQAHTFHPPDSDGARCVSCHMPYLQHPELGHAIPFARSDHTIAIPRPVFDADLGITYACAGCHDDRSPLELQAEVRERWGEIKPHRPTVQGQIDELRARNVREAAEALLHPGAADPLLQFQALAHLMEGYLRPDDADLPAEVVSGLEALARDPDREVRALALASLHWSRGNDPEVRALLSRALRAAARADSAAGGRTHEAWDLRGRWLLALGFLGDHYRERGDTARSRAAYEKALELRPGDPRVLDNLGVLLTAAGDLPEAVARFRESLAADSLQPLVWVNLGIALASQGEVVAAQEAYQRAAGINPHEPLAYFNLGNLHQRAGRFEEAAEAYRRAVAVDPGLGRAQFELARTLLRLERYEEALPHARRAVEFLRDHAPSRALLRDLERLTG